MRSTSQTKNVHGIFVCGTTGEGLLLRIDERKRLLEELVSAVGKKLNVVAQTGCLDTPTTIELTRHAADAGARAAAIVTPGFYGYDDDALRAHYKTVAKAVKDYPVLLYDIPSCAKNALSPEFVLQLAESIPNLVGLKESNRDIVNFSTLSAAIPKGFNLINGADEYSYQAYLSGGTGSVSSTANVVPELFLKIYANIRAGNPQRAWKFQTQLQNACALFRYGGLIARYKEGLRLRGFDPGYVRSPQRELTKKEQRELAKGMETLGLL